MKSIMILILLLMVPAVLLAQDDCGDGLPCGKLPWDLPDLLVLSSPTPMPTIAVTAIPTTGAGTPTYTPTPTQTPVSGNLDTSGISSNMATLNAVMNATPITIVDLQGTPVDNTSTFETLGSNAGQFFGYTRSLSELSLGKMSIFFNFSILAFVTVAGMKVLTFMWPVAAAAFSILRKAIQLILDFLPL